MRLYLVLSFYYCELISSWISVMVRIRIRFSVWLVSGCAHVFMLLSVVIVTLPIVPGYTGFILQSVLCFISFWF